MKNDESKWHQTSDRFLNRFFMFWELIWNRVGQLFRQNGPGGFQDASRILKTISRSLQEASRSPKTPPRGLQDPPRSIFPFNMDPLNLKKPSKSIGKIIVLGLYTNLT